MKPKTFDQVVAAGLCSGCGLCASGSRVELKWDTRAEFLRPHENPDGRADADGPLLVDCPGVNVAHAAESMADERDPIWGPVVAARAGAATETEARYRGSSGGVITALLIHLLETKQITGVLQVGSDRDSPLLSIPRISRTPDEILACAGSRYAPSPTLQDILHRLAPVDRLAIVGKPCDIVGFRNLSQRFPVLRERIPFAFSFFCAGVPSQQASIELVKRMGGAPKDVVSFRYRGNGWPGDATAQLTDGRELRMSYNESWGGVLSRHLQFRCKICPDGTGEFADIVGGDAWYGVDGYPDFDERDGRSAILTRTAVGESLVAAAIAAGVLVADSIDLREIDKMQPFQVRRKTTVLSRIAALHLLGKFTPNYWRLGLLRAMFHANIGLQVRSFLGTVSRVLFAQKST